MFIDFLNPTGFEPTNVQHGIKTRENNNHHYDLRSDLPVCPFYPTVEICAQLAGINPEELATRPRFCGRETKHEDTIRVLSGRRGTVYTPSTSCIGIRDTLISQLSVAKMDISLPTEKTKMAYGDPVSMEKKLKKEMELVQLYNQKQEILKVWRDTVYEICCLPSDSAEQEHFLPRSKDQLTDDFIIGRVETFLTALEGNVTGRGIHPEDKSFMLGQIENQLCHQAPHDGFVGEMS